ncbi:MAG: SH3 domain-containing protein, partial [Flavobacteriales bacterium]|nr:SH3 domain-containing protein [Flavobacteriales bacterium]
MEYGICNLGNVPIRSSAKDQAEIVSFLLFGEHFKISDFKKNWIKIITHHDNYEGWICSKQYREITYEDYDHLSINIFPICGSKSGEIINLSTGDVTPINLGAILPYYQKGKFKIRKQEYSTNVNLATLNKSDLEAYSKSLLNTPY